MADSLTTIKPPVIVFVHVHYPEIWREISALLAERLTHPFHLILTSSRPLGDLPLPETPARLSTQTFVMENRGRDILPFLRAMARAGDFEFALKLHTKKSPQRADGSQWLAEALNSLLPVGGVDGILARMQSDRRIGFVAPAGFCLSVKPWILTNGPGISCVMSTMGIDFSERDLEDAFFAAGSMFWFRRTAVADLADERLVDLFEAEEGQCDGTIAHAMERLFPVVARQRGCVSLSIPALLLSRPDMPTAELLELARCHADIPTSYFPGPYIPAFVPTTIIDTPPPRSRLRPLILPVYRSLPVGIRLGLRRLLGYETKTERTKII